MADSLKKLKAAIDFVKEHHPLPRCPHGKALLDGAVDVLEPACGCRFTFTLDPDFRRDAPENGAYCVQCQRPIKDTTRAVRVTIDWDTWEGVTGGKELIGQDCWRRIVLEVSRG